MGGSIYPAVQNMLLACRALGLGATLTSVTTLYEEEVKAILGLPDFLSTYAMLPIGYPIGKFGPVTRKPVEEVTWRNRYGTPFSRPET
jgi:nitroreductase